MLKRALRLFFIDTVDAARQNSSRAQGIMFTFCPLQGALSDSTASQSLLELDGGVKVLIDVGWDESFDVSRLEELEKCVKQPALASRHGRASIFFRLTSNNLDKSRHFP